MAADRVRGKARAPAALRRKARKGVPVSEEQRRRLVEACAFFRAERFREVGPGSCRAGDVVAAESDIDTVIEPRAGRRKRRP